MHKASKVTVTVMAVGIATISLTAPAHAGNRSAVSAGTWVLVSAPSSVAHSRRVRCMSLRRRPSTTRHRRHLSTTLRLRHPSTMTP